MQMPPNPAPMTTASSGAVGEVSGKPLWAKAPGAAGPPLGGCEVMPDLQVEHCTAFVTFL